MKDHFFLAFSNLRRRGLRSWLTMIGIFIGIAAVVGLISLGQGLQAAINDQFEQLGKDKIMIQSKTLGPPGSASSEKLTLTTKDLETIKNVRGVENVVGILMKTSFLNFKDESKITYAIGINPEDISLFSTIQSFKIEDGRSSRAMDVDKNNRAKVSANIETLKEHSSDTSFSVSIKSFFVYGNEINPFHKPPDLTVYIV